MLRKIAFMLLVIAATAGAAIDPAGVGLGFDFASGTETTMTAATADASAMTVALSGR